MPSTSDPQEAAQAALDRMKSMAGAETSNPGEQAAPGGESSETTARQWSDEETQRAQTYLRRFGVPEALITDDTRDQVYELGLNFEKMQQGISAKSKAKDEKIAQLESRIDELVQAVARKAPSRGATAQDDPRKAEVKALAEELGIDESKIGPALERLITSYIPKPEAGPKMDPTLETTVMELAIESARTQLVGEFPILQPDTPLFGEVLDTMQSLRGPRYDALPLGQREVTRMRDAATLVVGPSGGGGGSKQTPARSPGSSVPRPGGRSEAKPSEQTPIEAAQAALAKHGLR